MEFEIFEWNNVNVNKSFSDLTWVRSNYERFSKPDLISCCEENSIEYTKKDKKDDLKCAIKIFLRKNNITKVISLDYEKIVKNLNRHFENIVQNYKIDHVVIENQPCMKNPSMKSIQMILFSLFCLKTESKISFISASEKMKFCKRKSFINEIPKNYKATKNASIDVVLKVLESNSWKKIVIDSKKKDDLSDVFLQAFAFAKHKK